MSIASKADRHALYETAVQSPDTEVEFIGRTFNKLRKRKALTMREDFCGTAHFACEWVRSNKERTVTGIDLDKPTLDYGRSHHLPKVDAKRVTLLQQDVRDPVRGPFDVACAYNYSWWVFKQARELQRYFQSVHDSLADDGLFFLDIFGGATSQSVNLEPRKYRGFTYVWEQASFNPIDNDFQCHIHFEFKDGSKLTRAFSYDWRLWQLAEAREHLKASGFSEVSVYWEDSQGRFSKRTRVENEPSWNAYIIAEK